jgi:hypothetical protein
MQIFKLYVTLMRNIYSSIYKFIVLSQIQSTLALGSYNKDGRDELSVE